MTRDKELLNKFKDENYELIKNGHISSVFNNVEKLLAEMKEVKKWTSTRK